MVKLTHLSQSVYMDFSVSPEGQQSQCRLRIHRESPGKQLHSANVGALHRVVRGLHQKRAPSPWSPHASQPAGRPLHEAFPTWRAAGLNAVPLHHSQQEEQESQSGATTLTQTPMSHC